MKDKYIRETHKDRTVLNLRKGSQYAEIASGEDDGGRYFVVPVFGKTYFWPQARCWAIRFFRTQGFKSVWEIV